MNLSIERSTRRTTRGRAGVAASIALLAVSLVAACSGAADSGGSSSSAVDPAKTYNLTYWSWTKGSAEAVEAFNKAHPHIHVTFQQTPSGSKGGYAKVSDAFKAGNGPDVFNAEYVALPSFVAAGQVADLTSYLTPQATSGYLPQAMQMVTLGGRKWGVPSDIGAQVLYYRKDLFAQYGLTVPTTWQQFQDDAQKLTARKPGLYLANYTVDDPLVLEALASAAGANWFSTAGDSWTLNFTDQATTQVANFWQGLADKKLLAPVFSNTTGYTADVAAGHILSLVSVNWNASYNMTNYPSLAGKWGVSLLPSFDGQPTSGVLGGSTYAVSKSSKNTAAAAEFALWMTSNADAIKARTSGGSSAYYANRTALQVARDGFDTGYYGTDIYDTFDTAEHALKPWTFGPTMTATNQVLTTKLKGLSGGTTVADAIAAGAADAKQEMSTLGLNVRVQG
ncbi:ABC transporter substrate-binding protein [Rugosimonospora africana]|nr:sugar ABC transporter substrate-binding protein [Rugosimonospora africana]